MSERSIDTATPRPSSGTSGRFLRVYTPTGSIDLRIDEGAWTLGRGDEAQVRIEDPSVSRVHARLHIGAHALLEDLGSANGTRVAGRRLAPGNPVLLTVGMPFELGDALAVLRSDGRRPPTMLSTVTAGGERAGREAERIIERLALADVPVLIEGETGAGKDEMAQRIHARSKRAGSPMVRVSCALVRAGKADLGEALARAGEGTLLLDEVTDLDAAGQGVLLGMLPAPARLLSMSSRDLQRVVDAGRFRADLYYRLAHLTLVVPPLRTRTTELGDIAAALLVDIAAARGVSSPLLSADAVRALHRHPWPGNVRELRAALERAWVLSPARMLTAAHFEFLVEPRSVPSLGAEERPNQSLKEAAAAAEHERILEALRACQGNQTRAAKMLGISRGTLIARLERFHVPRPRKP